MSQINTNNLYIRQYELEQEATQLGVDRFERSVGKHRQRGSESQTKHGLKLIRQYTDRLAQEIQALIAHAQSGAPGRRHASVKLLQQIDARTAAYIALKEVIDSISMGSKYHRCAVHIGIKIEDEIRYSRLHKEHDKLYARLRKAAEKRDSYHFKRMLVNTVLKKENLDYDEWSHAEKLRVGEKLIDLIITHLGLCYIQEYTDECRNGRRISPNYIMPTDDLKEWIDKFNGVNALLVPYYQPMVVPPVDWTSVRSGGYLTQRVRPLHLVKTNNQAYLEELDAIDMPTVYAAVNAMQRTAWTINTAILDVMNEAYEANAVWAGIPPSIDGHIPPKPSDIATNEEAKKAWKQQAALIHSRNREQIVSRIQFNQVRNTANKFADYEAIYFPYHLDFRGRIYAGCRFNFQGADHTRALLKFADGKPLGEHGYKWLLIQGANLVGVDKVSFQDRCTFIEAHEAEIYAIVQDPFALRTWVRGFAAGCAYEKTPGAGLDVDKPWQFLAWCQEYARLLEHLADGDPVEDFVSHIPIAMDGSCSGIQHYSMALRDPVGGEAVNLVPGDKPQDIYQRVADVVTGFLRLDASKSGDNAAFARQWLDFGVTRKVCKRPVMTFPYGSGRFGYREQLREDIIKPAHKTPKWTFGDTDGYRAATYLAGKITDALPLVITKATEGMAYLKGVARIAAKEGLPVRWTTPAGFVVLQAYPETVNRQINTMINGRRVKIDIRDDQEKIDAKRQQNGISPNFIHSLDASHLMFTVVEAEARGITAMSLIHDSFGTHAGDAEIMFHTVRDTLAAMYDQFDVFHDFRTEIWDQLSDEGRTVLDEWDQAHYPEKGTMDPYTVTESLYSFA